MTLARSIDPLVLKAYRAWKSQRMRCNYPKFSGYKNYGARGIRVEYASNEFVDWWIKSYKAKVWIDPVVGRKDHSKNYNFENIEMLERSANTREVHDRLGQRGGVKKRPVAHFRNDGAMEIFTSTREASRALGVSQSSVFRICNNMVRRPTFKLEYLEVE